MQDSLSGMFKISHAAVLQFVSIQVNTVAQAMKHTMFKFRHCASAPMMIAWGWQGWASSSSQVSNLKFKLRTAIIRIIIEYPDPELGKHD